MFSTIIAMFFWGSNFAAIKLSLTSLPPWTAAAERFVIAALFISLVLHFKTGFKRRVLQQNIVAYVILGSVGIAGLNGALFIGLQTASSVTAALIIATTPLSANLLEAALERRLPDQWRIAGALTSLFGVALVVTNGALFTGRDFALVRGDLILVLGSLAWAAYTVGCRAFVTESSPLETTTWTMISGAITLVVMAFATEQPTVAVVHATVLSHVATAYIAIPGTVLAYLFFIIGISVRGPGRTSIFLSLIPVFALLISIAQGTVPSVAQVLGIVVTLLGVLVGDGMVSAVLKKVRTTS